MINKRAFNNVCNRNDILIKIKIKLNTKQSHLFIIIGLMATIIPTKV